MKEGGMEPFHFEKTTTRADCIAWLQKVDGLYSAKVSGEYKGHKESNGVTSVLQYNRGSLSLF